MRFSVCIPTYNRAELLPRAIESVLSQSHKDLELIVLDNASNDKTQELLSEVTDPRVRVFTNNETVTMYANHNLCVARAKEEWIVFLHSDDELRPNALEIISQEISDNNPSAVYPRRENHRTCLHDDAIIYSGSSDIPSVLRWPSASPSGAAIQKKLFEKVKFCENGLASDLLFMADLLEGENKISISKSDYIKMGVGEYQETHIWQSSRKFISEVALVVEHILSKEHTFSSLLKEVKFWTNNEVAFLLMALSHADRKDLIKKIEDSFSCTSQIKNAPNYRHVRVYKALGIHGLVIAYALNKRTAKFMRGLISKA